MWSIAISLLDNDTNVLLYSAFGHPMSFVFFHLFHSKLTRESIVGDLEKLEALTFSTLYLFCPAMLLWKTNQKKKKHFCCYLTRFVSCLLYFADVFFFFNKCLKYVLLITVHILYVHDVCTGTKVLWVVTPICMVNITCRYVC